MRIRFDDCRWEQHSKRIRARYYCSVRKSDIGHSGMGSARVVGGVDWMDSEYDYSKTTITGAIGAKWKSNKFFVHGDWRRNSEILVQ